MAFIRGTHTEASIWRYFRGEGDGFTFRDRNGICEAMILANADRIVELFLALAEHLPPAVTVAIEDLRSGDRWEGEDQALVDARDAVARLKGALASSGGVEFSLVGADDQLTLTANLEIFVYARTDRWLYLLQGKGLRRRGQLRARSWRLSAGEFAAAPTTSAAVKEAADRLGLTPARAGSP
ncbi:MAG: hypothetical protein IPF98_17750 [Gemmatimonadetes bacterium]|nr:hypothetical protein [Gemmatimonadota bacterium]MCC6773108.1 hypothetical protein [Gemmatimonadaceae bacterium]